MLVSRMVGSFGDISMVFTSNKARHFFKSRGAWCGALWGDQWLRSELKLPPPQGHPQKQSSSKCFTGCSSRGGNARDELLELFRYIHTLVQTETRLAHGTQSLAMVENLCASLSHSFRCLECNSSFAIECMKGRSKYVSSVVAAASVAVTRLAKLTPSPNTREFSFWRFFCPCKIYFRTRLTAGLEQLGLDLVLGRRLRWKRHWPGGACHLACDHTLTAGTLEDLCFSFVHFCCALSSTVLESHAVERGSE